MRPLGTWLCRLRLPSFLQYLLRPRKALRQQGTEDIRIYVFATENSNGFADAASRDSGASVDNLKKVLARAHFTVVDSRSDASVSVGVEHGYMPGGHLNEDEEDGRIFHDNAARRRCRGKADCVSWELFHDDRRNKSVRSRSLPLPSLRNLD